MNKQVKDLTFIAMYVAVALVLDYAMEFLPFLHMPKGGSIQIAIIPMVLASFHLGWKKGVLVGMLWWLIGFLFLGLHQWWLNPMQYALDYLIPTVILGMACVFPRIGKVSNVIVGTIVVCVVRYITTVLSGVYFWVDGVAAGSVGAWTFSLSYNLWYNLATLIVAVILVPLVVNRLGKYKKEFIGIK